MVQGSKVTAKARAREAHAELLRARRDHDQKVLAATEAWYEASEVRTAAEAALAAAVAGQGQAIAALTDLKMTVDEVAALCGISASEVRSLGKRKSDEQSS